MYIPRRIYYEIDSGRVILETGNFYDKWATAVTATENEIQAYKILSERNRATFDYIELEYGQYTQDFAECNGYRVNVDTRTLEFSYPDPNEPEAPPVYQAPLSEEVSTLKATNEELSNYMLDVDMRLTMIELGF